MTLWFSLNNIIFGSCAIHIRSSQLFGIEKSCYLLFLNFTIIYLKFYRFGILFLFSLIYFYILWHSTNVDVIVILNILIIGLYILFKLDFSNKLIFYILRSSIIPSNWLTWCNNFLDFSLWNVLPHYLSINHCTSK